MGGADLHGSDHLDERSIRKIAGLSPVGANAEWFDFFGYGTAAGLVPHRFFPKVDPTVGGLLSFATFGVGFVAARSAALSGATSAIGWAARRRS